jgi:hypothetical protein
MNHSILFTGHMIDEKEREESRFPARKEMLVKAEILQKLVEVKAKTKKLLIGIAGGACGGDILFHETCKKIGIHTEMYLALPPEEYKKRSVSFAGPEWVTRFDFLTKNLLVHVLPDSKNIDKQNNLWAATNLWMLDNAIEIGNNDITLIALWDGKDSDLEGGTKHMIDTFETKVKGIKPEIIYINNI